MQLFQETLHLQANQDDSKSESALFLDVRNPEHLKDQGLKIMREAMIYAFDVLFLKRENHENLQSRFLNNGGTFTEEEYRIDYLDWNTENAEILAKNLFAIAERQCSTAARACMDYLYKYQLRHPETGKSLQNIELWSSNKDVKYFKMHTVVVMKFNGCFYLASPANIELENNNPDSFAFDRSTLVLKASSKSELMQDLQRIEGGSNWKVMSIEEMRVDRKDGFTTPVMRSPQTKLGYFKHSAPEEHDVVEWIEPEEG